MHLKLRRKPSRRPLEPVAERSRETCKSLTINPLYKIDILAQGISRLAADVHLWSAEKYGVIWCCRKKYSSLMTRQRK